MSSAPTAREEHCYPAPMALLKHGVPLSLLLDLAFGPRSEDLLRDERVDVPPPRVG